MGAAVYPGSIVNVLVDMAGRHHSVFHGARCFACARHPYG